MNRRLFSARVKLNRRCTAFGFIRSRIYLFHAAFTWISVSLRSILGPPPRNDGRAVRWKPVLFQPRHRAPSSLLLHAGNRRRYVPSARATSHISPGEAATHVRIARRDRIASHRVGTSPRAAPSDLIRRVELPVAAGSARAGSGATRRDAIRARDPRGGRGRPLSAFASRDRRRPPPRDLARPHPPDSSIALPIG